MIESPRLNSRHLQLVTSHPKMRVTVSGHRERLTRGVGRHRYLCLKPSAYATLDTTMSEYAPTQRYTRRNHNSPWFAQASGISALLCVFRMRASTFRMSAKRFFRARTASVRDAQHVAHVAGLRSCALTTNKHQSVAV